MEGKPKHDPVEAPTIAPRWFWLILLLALLAALFACLSAPDIDSAKGPPDWFQLFFATSAGVIATLFITLALGSTQINASVPAAIATVGYIAVGELAALAAISPALPVCLYKFLLGATVGAGVGALASAVVISGHAISNDAWQRRERRLGEILGRTLKS
jgi:ribose/xylose/arabinose/galactoside ABC-type transport system permease subunit